MKKNLYFIFIAASFALLVASPGRLAYGIPLIIELLFLTAAGTVFNIFLQTTELESLNEIICVSVIIFLTVLYKQILIMFSPVIALTLSFVIYIPAVSAFLLSMVFSEQAEPFQKNMKTAGIFAVFALLFFFLRDILGYGTLTFPARNSIAEKYIFDSEASAFLSFFAAIPGALLLLIFCMVLLLTVQIKMNIIERAGGLNADN